MNNNEKMSASRWHGLGNQPGVKFFMIILLTIFISLLSACATTPMPDPEPEPEPDPMDIVVEYPGDHLKEPVGTVTIGNETIDLAKLKQEKGDLYRLYEPLTEQEIEDIYKIISEYEKKRSLIRETTWISMFGYTKADISESELNALMDLEIEVRTSLPLISQKIYNNEISGLERFKSLITIKKETSGEINYRLPSISIYEIEDPLHKEMMLRVYNMFWDLFLQGVKERNLNYKPILFSKNNECIL